jgi:hypothetical protein
MPSPHEAPELWDKIVIGKVELPPAGVRGHVAVDVKPKLKNTKTTPPGTAGGRTAKLGLDLADVDIELRWVDAPGQYALVETAIRKVWPPPANAQSVTHGGTALYDVRDIELLGMEGPKWDSGWGTIKIKAREWRTPVITGGKGSGSAAGAIDSEIAYLEAKLNAIHPTSPAEYLEQQNIINRLIVLKTQKAAGNSGASSATKADPSKQWGGGGGRAAGSTHTGVPASEVAP